MWRALDDIKIDHRLKRLNYFSATNFLFLKRLIRYVLTFFQTVNFSRNPQINNFQFQFNLSLVHFVIFYYVYYWKNHQDTFQLQNKFQTKLETKRSENLLAKLFSVGNLPISETTKNLYKILCIKFVMCGTLQIGYKNII